ncbi:MAG: hypothetical protein ACJAZ1_003050 [Yoonia sp.]|jgi:hypothetical protein
MLCAPAYAQDAMSGAQFDTYVTGKAITFRTITNPEFGVERYLSNRRVMWSAFDGTCQYGVWFESKGNICFRYEGDPEHKCWEISKGPNGLRGVYTTRPNTTIIYELLGREDPLICNDLSS